MIMHHMKRPDLNLTFDGVLFTLIFEYISYISYILYICIYIYLWKQYKEYSFWDFFCLVKYSQAWTPLDPPVNSKKKKLMFNFNKI